jgi:hypothetical protein
MRRRFSGAPPEPSSRWRKPVCGCAISLDAEWACYMFDFDERRKLPYQGRPEKRSAWASALIGATGT